MKNKTLTLIVFSVFAFALLAGFASASTIFSDDFETDLSGWTITTNWAHNNTGKYAESVDKIDAILSRTISTFGFQDITVKYDRQLTDDWEVDDNFKVSWSVDGNNFTVLEEVVGSGDTSPSDVNFVPKTFNLPSSANHNANFELKFECTTSAVAESCKLDNVVVEGTFTPLEILECSTTGNPGFLKIKDIDFDNKGVESAHSRFGSDDEWFPLEEIEVEIEIENDGDFDIDDIEVEWGLWDIQRGEWAIDLDDEKDFNLKDGKDELLTISFVIDDDMDLDLDELSDNTDNYRFYVTATGVIDDNDSPNNEEDTCVSGFDVATIIIENDFVVLDNIDFPEVISCGETVTVTADVWNIGESDQDEVSVFVFNKELDLRKDIIMGDIDEFDNAELSFTFKVPNGLEEKTYSVLFEVFDEDNDIYENDLDDDESEFFVPFRVGNCVAIADEISVSASLVSEAKAGQSLVVRATITNTMLDSGSFSVSAAGFGSWASSVQIDQPKVSLNAGESRDVLLTFDVAKDAKGSQNFFVEIVSDDGKVTRQPVQVDIAARSLFGFTGSSIFGGGNAYLWGIGLLNIILVIVIIIVAVRIARR